MSTGVETTPILEPLRYPEQDPKLASKRFLDLASIVGPGFILASVTIGNGEVFQATRGGAVFGYTILWTFVLGAIFKATVTYAAGRYMVITGEHPFARMGHLLPGVGQRGIGRHWLAVFFGTLAAVCQAPRSTCRFRVMASPSGSAGQVSITAGVWLRVVALLVGYVTTGVPGAVLPISSVAHTT